MSHRERKAKILATLGPATDSRDMIAALYKAGANGFRLNFSHGDHATMEQTYQAIREVEKEALHPIAVVGDLQGPKLRVGEIAGGVVDRDVGAECLDVVQVVRPGGGRHLGAAMLGHLDGQAGAGVQLKQQRPFVCVHDQIDTHISQPGCLVAS